MKPEDPPVALVKGWAVRNNPAAIGSAFCLGLGYAVRDPGGVPGARETNRTFVGTTD
jgi:hypothetical protein